jgi:hypothetical protein
MVWKLKQRYPEIHTWFGNLKTLHFSNKRKNYTTIKLGIISYDVYFDLLIFPLPLLSTQYINLKIMLYLSAIFCYEIPKAEWVVKFVFINPKELMFKNKQQCVSLFLIVMNRSICHLWGVCTQKMMKMKLLSITKWIVSSWQMVLDIKYWDY